SGRAERASDARHLALRLRPVEGARGRGRAAGRARGARGGARSLFRIGFRVTTLHDRIEAKLLANGIITSPCGDRRYLAPMPGLRLRDQPRVPELPSVPLLQGGAA